MRTKNSSVRSRQRGVTLVELMVALLLGLVLTGGFIQVFMSNRVTYQFNEGLSRLQENGRFAIDTLNFRTRMAGYYGCLSEIAIFNNLNDAGTLPFNFAEGLAGFEADGSDVGETVVAGSSNPANSTNEDDWTPSLPSELDGRVTPGSDVLVIRNISAASHALRSPFSDGDEVSVTASAAEYGVGDIAVVSDCQKASIFQITTVTTEGANEIKVAHAGGGENPGNAGALATWDTDQTYSAGAELMRAETYVYFVGAAAAGEPPGLVQGRLRTTGAGTAELVFEELVESVETMQVLYGLDSDGDGAVNEYEPADGVGDWTEVVAVRIGLLLRAPDEYGPEVDEAEYAVNGTTFDPADDRRVRQVFTTTIALRNRLP